MKFKTTTKKLLSELVLKQYQLEEEFKENDELFVDIKKHSKSRSLLQNSKYWAIIDKIAKSDKNDIKKSEELHRMYISTYGVPIDEDKKNSTAMVLEQAMPFFKKTLKYYRELDRVEKDGKRFVYIQAMKGSSDMTMYEMYEIILAVIQEAEDLGIDVSYESKELKSLMEVK